MNKSASDDLSYRGNIICQIVGNNDVSYPRNNDVSDGEHIVDMLGMQTVRSKTQKF